MACCFYNTAQPDENFSPWWSCSLFSSIGRRISSSHGRGGRGFEEGPDSSRKGSGVVVVKCRAKGRTCSGSNVSYRVVIIWAVNEHAWLFVRSSCCSVIWSCLMYSFQCDFLPIAYLWSPDHTMLDCGTVPMAISIGCCLHWCFFRGRRLGMFLCNVNDAFE